MADIQRQQERNPASDGDGKLSAAPVSPRADGVNGSAGGATAPIDLSGERPTEHAVITPDEAATLRLRLRLLLLDVSVKIRQVGPVTGASLAYSLISVTAVGGAIAAPAQILTPAAGNLARAAVAAGVGVPVLVLGWWWLHTRAGRR